MGKLAPHPYVYGTDAGEEEEEETEGRTGARRREKRQCGAGRGSRCCAGEEDGVGEPSLRKCLQDGVHLLGHGCQSKLELLLRREKKEGNSGRREIKGFSNAISE